MIFLVIGWFAMATYMLFIKQSIVGVVAALAGASIMAAALAYARRHRRSG